MERNNAKKSKLTTEDAENVSFVFPKSEEIVIPKSDLQIWLDKFKTSIRSSFSIFDVLAILSFWAPILTADFKPIEITNKLGVGGLEVRAGYIVFAVLITGFIIFSRGGYFTRGLRNGVSNDPEKMANKILELCQKAER